MNDIRAELREISNEVRRLLLQTADTVDHWAAGLEAGVPQPVVIAAMKQASATLRGQALKP